MTTAGRALCLIYAILGIPMCLLILADFGQLLTRGVQKLCYLTWRRTRKKILGQIIARWCVKKSIRERKMTVNDFQRVAKVILATGEVKKITVASNTRFAQVVRQKMAVKSDGAEASGETPAAQPASPPAALPAQSRTRPSIRAIAKMIKHNKQTQVQPTHKITEVKFKEKDFDPPPILTIFLMLIYILLGGLMYMSWETWTYLESLYFISITMTTIGFGDFMPAHQKYFLASSVYVFIGLTLVSMVINSLIVYGQKGVDEIERILDLDDDSDDDEDDEANTKA